MNGKQAKMLRRLQRASHDNKRTFHKMDDTTKNFLRSSVTEYVESEREAKIQEKEIEVNE